jgi:KAP family P-loop domain
VIGIAGSWGEGKSSVLNMVAKRVTDDGTAQVIRFNPWLFAEADDLLERFFSEFSAQVKLRGDKTGDRLARALGRYGHAAAPLTVVPAAGIPVEVSRRLALGGAELLRAGTSLKKRRDNLLRALNASDRPVLVIIDDLDRLHSHREVAEMARLIRLVGDLPRVTYLIAFDRPIIARALGGGKKARGDRYLEKIVQAVFELPPIRRDLLENLLGEAVQQAVAETGVYVSRQRLTTLQIAGVYRLFRNLRDVRRFASALPAVVAAVGDEVEFADVLALESLRLIQPNVFVWIAENADFLTGHHTDLVAALRDRDGDTSQRIEALNQASTRPDIVRDLVRELFPAAARHLGGTNYDASGFQGQWRRERRVAHYDVLITYLARGLPGGALPAGVVEHALRQLDDREALAQLVDGISASDFQRLLERLTDYEGVFALEHPEIAIDGLTATMFRLHPEPSPGLSSDPHSALWRVVLRILRTRQQAEIEEIVNQTSLPNLSAQAYLIHLLRPDSENGLSLVSAEWAAEREKQLVDLLLGAPVEALRDERDLGHLLWRAAQLEPDRAAARINELIADPAFLIRWLAESMLEKTGSYGLARLLPWSQLTQVVEQAQLAEAVGALDESWVAARGDEREQEALKQAKHYAQNPAEAEQHLEAFRGFSPGPWKTI